MAIARIQMPDGKIARFEVPDAAPRPIGKELGRQAGLTARYVAEGIASPFATVANLPAAASNAVLGTNFPEQNAAVSNLLTSAGLPNPQGGTERVVGDVSRALEGVGSGAPISKIAGAPKYVRDMLSSNLGTQAASAIGAAGSAGLTREAGGGAGAQLAAGIVGGVIPVGGYQVAARGLGDLYGAGKEAVKPFTTSGRNQIVGGILADSADNPSVAAANLKNVKQYVPNSPVTTAEASGDAGIAGLQRGFRNQGANPFSDIESQQNAARNRVFDILAGDKDITAVERAARDANTAPLRETAFGSKRNVLPMEPLDEIAAIMKSPVGKRDAVSSAMKWARDKISAVKDPEELYAIRQDINDAMQGKFDGDKPALRLAKSQLKQVKDALDNAIERGAPGFKAYVEKYAAASKPINQQELLQDIRNRVSLAAAPDQRTGYEFLSQPKLSNILRDESGELKRTLTPDQLTVLGSVSKDMERSAAINARNIRASGSDTVQNLNGGKVVKEFLSEHAAGKLPLGIGIVLQSMSEKQINELTVEALKDPQLARRLLVELKPETAKQSYSNAAAQKFIAQVLGSMRGTLSTPTQVMVNPNQPNPYTKQDLQKAFEAKKGLKQ